MFIEVNEEEAVNTAFIECVRYSHMTNGNDVIVIFMISGQVHHIYNPTKERYEEIFKILNKENKNAD